MLKVFAYLRKKEGIERQAFIDYYENHHVPLVLSLANTGEVLSLVNRSERSRSLPRPKTRRLSKQLFLV